MYLDECVVETSAPISGLVAGEPIEYINLGHGEVAIENTVKKIKQIINRASRKPYVRKWAEYIIRDVPDTRYYQELVAIQRFVRDNMRYTRDPRGMEFIQTPVYLLTLIERGLLPQGDCDDKTTLSLSLAKSIGFPVALRITGYRPNRKFKHIYGMVQVKIGKSMRWIPMETVKKNRELGWESPNPTRMWTEPI